jgi:hypothetical protein
VSLSVATETIASDVSHLSRRHIDGREVTMIHPPCRLEWVLPMDTRAVALDFGFDPKAVADGTTNGAEIFLDLQDGETTRPLYRRYLDPQRRPADRGSIPLRILLPPFGPSSRLILRSDPGTYGDSAWDWVYLGSLIFQRAPDFSPEQFPGFNRVPNAADAPNSSIVARDGAQVFEADPPTTLKFRLRGEEQRLRLAFGLRPEAYTSMGRTDGATFRVELQRPGEPARPVWSRLLQPVTHDKDRGLQEATIPLPAVQRDDELIVRIDAGPAGNGAWDSTYLRRVVID